LGERKNVNIIYIWIAVIFAGIGIHDYNIKLPFLNELTCRGYYAFFAGLILRNLWERVNPDKYSLLFFISLFMIGISFLFYKVTVISQGTFDDPYLLSFFTYPSIVILCETSKGLQEIFKWSIWRHLGGVSYHAYIWQIIPLIWLQITGLPIDLDSVKTMIVYALIVWGIGEISYRMIQPLLKKVVIKVIRDIK
jgi:peptidoglycan/LPS O-acetylase OafA/YrhL